MPIPDVVCGADVEIGVAATSGGYVMNLSATATPGPISEYRWTLLYVPTGGSAALNSGDFSAGVAVGQNVSFTAPDGVVGDYVAQCVATNATGPSNPYKDGEAGQQVLDVADSDGVRYPGDFRFSAGAAIRDSFATLKTLGGGGGGSNDKVKVSSNDTTEGFLGAKVVIAAETALKKTELNDGSNESLELDIDIAGRDPKATPVSADLLLIEDSADSNNQKKVQVGNLPGTSPLTTKGDLFAYATGDQRLARGPDGTLLVSRDAEATGLAYETAESVLSLAIAGSSRVVMKNSNFGSTQTISSGTFADIPGGAFPENVFDILTTGTYDLYIVLASLSSAATNQQSTVEYQLIVDEGDYNGFSAQTIGAGVAAAEWEVFTANGGTTEWEAKTVFSEVTLEAGEHKVKFQAKNNGGNPRVATSGGMKIVAVLRTGEIVRPDNVPVFERDASDTSLIRANAAPGASTDGRIELSDGYKRTATYPLTCDIDSTGLGGRDAADAAPAAGDIYWVYAVIASTPGEFELVLSKTSPIAGGGPPSYSVHRVLSPVRVKSIGPVVLERFQMSTDGWYQPHDDGDDDYTLDGITGGTPGTIGSWINNSTELQAVMPEGADTAEIEGYLFNSAGTTENIFVSEGNPPSWTPTASSQPFTQRFLAAGSDFELAAVCKRIVTPDRTLSHWISNSLSISYTIRLRSYRFALYPGSGGRAVEPARQTRVTVEATGPKTLTTADSPGVFTNEGATAEVEFNLPSAVAGLSYFFVVQDSDGIQVNAAAGDTIRIAGSVSAGGGLIEATTVGNTVHLVAINATEWVALSHEGTWTVT